MAWNWPWSHKDRVGIARVERKDSPLGGLVAFHAQGEARWTRRDYAALAREGFMRNPIVHRSVRLIAEAAASVPWLLYEGVTELDEHPLLALLARPNQRQAGGTFLEALYGHLLLSGNAYVELIGDGARELHLLRPDRVSVVTDAGGWPAALEYREGSARRRVELGAGGGAAQLTLFHPLDDHYGFAPLEAALMALDTHNAAGRWNKALLDNSARPSGALVYAPKDGGNLTDDQFDRLKAELEQGYSGVQRAGRPLLLEGGLDWKAMSLTPKDMDFIEARNAASRDIALAFGVPPMLLGIPGDNTYANYREANRAFYRLTVLPLVGRTAKDLSNWLAPVFGADLRLGFDADQLEGLAADRDALWARIGAANFLSNEEKREAVGYGVRKGFVDKAGYRPEQPRVPAGNSDGGQWTDDGGGQLIRVGRNSRNSGGGRRTSPTPRNITQQTRLINSNSQVQTALRRVRELDPNWRPPPQIYETVEGEIAANNAIIRAAEARRLELQQVGIGPGPFALEWQPARGPGRHRTANEIRENNRIGRKYGCHTCGTTEPGTISGNFILDHQLPNKWNFPGGSQRIFPHCATCSARQGNWLMRYRKRDQ